MCFHSSRAASRRSSAGFQVIPAPSGFQFLPAFLPATPLVVGWAPPPPPPPQAYGWCLFNDGQELHKNKPFTCLSGFPLNALVLPQSMWVVFPFAMWFGDGVHPYTLSLKFSTLNPEH
jgi:hypothetical protein